MKRARSSLAFSLLLVIGDAMAVLAAYVLAYILRVSLDHTPITHSVSAAGYFESLLVLLPFIIILFSLIGTYQARRQRKLARIGRLLTGAFGAMLFIIFIDYFANQPIFPAKLVPLYGFGLSIVFLGLGRGALYFARWFLRRRGLKQNVILVGSGAKLRQICNLLAAADSGMRIQAVVSDDKKLATHKTFAGATRNFQPDIIIQIATREQPNLAEEIRDFAARNWVDLKFVPRELSDLTEDINPELLLGETLVMAVQPTKLTGWGRVFKRLFDIVISGLALVILSPIMLVIWLVLFIDYLVHGLSANGRPIYRRKRLTRYGKDFTIYKFRSMKIAYNNMDPEAGFKKLGRPELVKEYRDNGDFLKNDPRINRFGNFLRKTSLDELPQLFNVLRGDISLVGPRALVEEELSRSEHKNKILNVKSGLTGLAVISGRKDLPFERRRQLDAYYVQNWSFGLDLQILFKTVWLVLTGRGAK
jgi:exopolysaccharide biosynthesis polyprenyl glycosylphosphotransferase